MLIRSLQGKILSLIGIGLLSAGIFLCLSVGNIFSLPIQLLTASSSLWGGVYLCTRYFRSESETDAERPWWKITDSRSATLALAVLLALSILSRLVTFAYEPTASIIVMIPESAFLTLIITNRVMLTKNKKQESARFT